MFNYPYTNFHRLNLDWIVSKIEQIERGDYTPVNFQIANVLDFGAKGNGIDDDSAAISNAVNTGLPVYFPVGTYSISRPIIPVTEGQMFFGAGWRSLLVYKGPSAFDCDGVGKIYIENMAINEDDPHRAAGYAIANMRGQYSAVHRVRIQAYNGIENGANSGIVSDCEIRCVADGIKIYNGDNTSTIENCIIASYDFTGTPDLGNGIVVESGACATLKNVSTLLKLHGIHFAGTFSSFDAIQCWFDQCNNGFFFTEGSHALRFRINNCWFSNAESDILFKGSVNGMWFDNCEFYRTNFAGIFADPTATINNLNVTNCLFTCRSNTEGLREGIHIVNIVSNNIIINNNNFSPYDAGANYHVAISINPDSSGIITGNCFKGAEIPVNGAGANMTVANNAV